VENEKPRTKRSVTINQKKEIAGAGEIVIPLSNSVPSMAVVAGPKSAKDVELERRRLLEERIKILEMKKELSYELPHLYGWKFYPWARKFFESRNKQNFLCAANQISKSSTQMRKAIHWATEDTLWPQLWRRRPTQFWYLYPSQEVVNAEFELKWKREFLPRGAMKSHPKYGWDEIKDRDGIKGIKFYSGVYLFFKTYTKNVQNMQTGTVDAIFCDEELPEHLYSELNARLTSTDGYFHMVFTATLGQNIWRLTMEPGSHEEEKFPDAFKLTISLYEAMFYEDGTPSHWTEERIGQIKAMCKSHQEILKRVYGRFIVLEGRVYPTFDASKHMVQRTEIPKDWFCYSGVDIGSGGESNHPAAITFVAVSPTFRAAKVFLGWRGDRIITTDGDIVNKHEELKKLAEVKPMFSYYDWSSKDFDTVASRMGFTFLKANKSHEVGEGVLNTLFKHNMIEIFEDPELGKLAEELSTLRITARKTHSRDDFIDSLRYAVSSIPWDFSGITGAPLDQPQAPEKKLTGREKEIEERRKAFDEPPKDEWGFEEEFNDANDAYGA
jgi:phage terminase large subunit-like protein